MRVTSSESAPEAEKGRVTRFEEPRVDENVDGLDVSVGWQKAREAPKD